MGIFKMLPYDEEMQRRDSSKKHIQIFKSHILNTCVFSMHLAQQI